MSRGVVEPRRHDRSSMSERYFVSTISGGDADSLSGLAAAASPLVVLLGPVLASFGAKRPPNLPRTLGLELRHVGAESAFDGLERVDLKSSSKRPNCHTR